MIDYIRQPAGFAEAFGRYNRLYSESELHFKIANLADDFLHRIVERIDGSVVDILETGCGQGEFVAKLANYLSDAIIARDGRPKINVRGVDGSEVAIRQCSQHYPEHHWVCDSVQGLLSDHASRFPGESYDIILDKGGIILFSSEDERDSEIYRYSITFITEATGRILRLLHFDQLLRHQVPSADGGLAKGMDRDRAGCIPQR